MGGAKRFGELQAGLVGEPAQAAARLPGDEGRWTRNRSMPLEDILRCTLFKKGLTAPREVRQYVQAAGKIGPQVSKQDYLKQRRQLNHDVFKLLHTNYPRDFYQGNEAVKWRGYVVLAVDGSRVEVPDSAENRREYGESINKYGAAVARANFSAVYDVYNRFIVDIGIHHYRSSEIAEARAHLPEIKHIMGEQPVLILFDRNYASLECMNYLEKAGVQNLIRLHSTDYKAQRAGMRKADEPVHLAHPAARLEQVRRAMPERAGEASRPAQIIKMTVRNGEEGTLIPNRGPEHRAAEIKARYRKRWRLEQQYHPLKNKMRFESVRGKASIYVRQDFGRRRRCSRWCRI